MSHDPTAPPPPEVSSRPNLTPSFCFNTTALRDFLRLSRATSDDSVSLHLNSLLAPSRLPFSTTTQPTYGRSRQQVPASICTKFKNDTLFPSWRDRETVLSYCGEIAANPTSIPDPAQMETRQVIIRMPSDKLAQANKPLTNHKGLDPYDADYEDPGSPRNYFNQPQVVDERTDPYSGRDYSWNREPRTETLRSVLESERGVERIVRARTWTLLAERCLPESGQDSSSYRDRSWEGEWQTWNRKTTKQKANDMAN